MADDHLQCKEDMLVYQRSMEMNISQVVLFLLISSLQNNKHYSMLIQTNTKLSQIV